MLLSGSEVQPLFAMLAVLLDNCSSLFDCWDTLGAAAAAAVGAGAAAVFVGGLLLSPGEGTGIVEEGVPLVAPGIAATPPATFQGGAATTTVAQAQPQVQPEAAAPSAPQVATGPVASVQPGPVAPSSPGGPATPDPAFGASPATPAPITPAPITSVAPVAPPTVDAGLVGGLAAGVAPVINTMRAVADSIGSSSGRGGDRSGEDQDEGDADEATCPEADASLFGLPDINTRQDCPGTRHGMPPNYGGIDFTSNDDYGRPTELPFEAGVTGEVTYVGGSFNSVQVTLENGNRIQFLHASQVLVQLGQQVEPTTVLGRTGGTGPYGPNQYEIHLHVQAFDQHGNLVDPDCALSGGENRRLRRKVIEPETGRESGPAPGATAVLTGTQPLIVAQVPQMPVQTPAQAPPPPPQAMPPATPPAQAELRCTRCGNVSPANSLFCAWCGQTFVQAAAPTPPPPTAPPPSVPPQTIYCGNCGQANAWGSVYCGRCGVKLTY